MTAHIVPFPPRHGSTPTASFAQDRAAITTTTVIQLIEQALLVWFERDDVNLAAARAAIEMLLREEFADVQRQAIADRGDPNA
jgi:hypothetical protein